MHPNAWSGRSDTGVLHRHDTARRAVRIALVLAAGRRAWRRRPGSCSALENPSPRRRAPAGQTLDAVRDQIGHAIDDSRTAQQAYLAQGQGLDFWEAKFAEAMASLTQGLAALRAQANEEPAAIEALDAADRALKVYEGVDRRIRSFVVNGTDLMAADAVYEDGLKTAGVIGTP